MASEASSSLVLFIAAITVAAIAAGAMATVVGKLTVEFQDRGDHFANAVGTDIAIVNDPKNVPYDTAEKNLTVYVKNTGTATLSTDQLTVFVDGVHATYNATLLNGAEVWMRGVVAELTVDADLATGDHRVRVVHTPNVADNLDFRV